MEVSVFRCDEKKQLVKYIIHVKNIDNKYWCDFGLIETIDNLNKLNVLEKVNANCYIDMYDISFGNENNMLILNSNNVNIYLKKIEKNVFSVDVNILSLTDSFIYANMGIDNFNFCFELTID